MGLAQKALRNAVGAEGGGLALGGFNIKGASSIKDGNVVQVSGLVGGTTAADVEVSFPALFFGVGAHLTVAACAQAIFKRCGAITSSKLHSPPSSDSVAIRIIFKSPASATTAVQKFNGQQADGRTLHVSIVGGAGVSLGGRLLGLEGVTESVDVLMESNGDSGGS